MPWNGGRVLRINPEAETAEEIGADLGTLAGKWVAAVAGPDGCIFGVPWNAAQVGVGDPRIHGFRIDLGTEEP